MTAQGVLQCLLVIALLAGFADGMCINATTASYEKCEYEGQTYEKGEEFQPNNCTWCKCDIDQDGSGDVTCTETACEMPMCENPVQEPDQCCPICNETSTTTTTPSPTCEYYGQIYQPGEEWKPEPCEICWCESDGSTQCAMYGCYGGSMCYDEEYIPGVDCCPRCPNGPNCRVGDTVLKGGETAIIESQNCTCFVNYDEGSGAYCFPVCEHDGKIYKEEEIDCPSPECVDSIIEPDHCCPTCPNGPNCLVGDTVLKGGEAAIIESQDCTCVVDYSEGSRAYCIPVCEHDGKIYQEGEMFQKDPCTFCECGRDNDCAVIECPSPECVDPITQPDQCCPTCPNGPNCKHGDTVISSGETLTTDSGERCMCESWSLEAVCESPPSPPPSPSPTTPTPTIQ